MKKYLPINWQYVGVIVCVFLHVHNAFAESISTTSVGDRKWSSTSTWSTGKVPTKDDNVTISNFVNLDANWGPQNSGSVIFNADASGAGTLNMSNGVIEIRANVTLTGSGVNLNGGTIHVYSGYTLTMPGFNEASTNIIVDAGATIIINGDLLNNKGTIYTDGLITINGQYNGQASNAVVTGSGDITTTGSMQGINQSQIFDTQNPYCPSNCDGRNLFGGGSCNGTATAIPNATSICSGILISFTSTLTGGYTNGNPLAYQWQLKNNSGYFENISGATLSSYSTSPTTSQTYRVVIGDKQNSGDAYCYKYSPTVLIAVSPCIKNWVGGTAGAMNDWFTATNWSPSSVPISTDNILIATSTYYPVILAGATVTAKNVVINNGCNLTSSANSVFNLSGNINNTGTWTSASGAILNLVGTAAQSITGLTSVVNVGINNSAGVSILSAMSINGTVSLIKGVLTTNNNVSLNFDNGANIAYNASDLGSITGNVTCIRNLVAKTHYIGVPFSGVTSEQVQEITPLYVSPYWKMYTKDFVKQNWAAVTNTTTSMPLGTGFSLSLPTAENLKLSGTYNHAFTFTSPFYSNVATQKYFLVGNPYPSTLDWDNASGWTKNKIGGSIYYWNPVTSQTATYVNGAAINNGSQFIPAMQAFLVVCDGTGGSSSLSINNNARISLQNPSYWRVAMDDMIHIHLIAEDSTLNDETVIRFNEDATNNFDFDLDAYKILNSGLNPSIFTREGTQTYSINSYSRPDSAKSVPLLAKLATDGTYTISFENNNPNIQYVLLDRQLGIEQPITDAYTFVGSSKDSVNRFELQLRETSLTITTGLQSANKTRGLQINSSVKGFIIQSDRFVGAIANIEVIDMTGNVVKNIPNQSIASNTTFVPLDLTDGSYIVKVTIDSELYTGLIVAMK